MSKEFKRIRPGTAGIVLTLVFLLLMSSGAAAALPASSAQSAPTGVRIVSSGGKKYLVNKATGKKVTGKTGIKEFPAGSGNYYYFKDKYGQIYAGTFVKKGTAVYCVRPAGPLWKGWWNNGKVVRYYDPSTFKKSLGWKKINGIYYYFQPSTGNLMTGFVNINGKSLYLDPAKGGARANGWVKIGKYYYYFVNGVKKTGWMKLKGKTYYFLSDGRRVISWRNIGGKRYYFSPYTGAMVTGTMKWRENTYTFDNSGALMRKCFLPDGGYADAGGCRLQKSTLKKFLKTALKPVGSTMYVWGGGWNEADTGSGTEARTIGVSPRWKNFYSQQNSSYNYNSTRYQIHDGLDCSGYVGWVIYNAFNTVSGNSGYVMSAGNMASTYASWGWGTYKSAAAVKDYRAGDIMSSSGHVYIVVGSCSDGSVVLLHSSPKGVMISGTAARSGSPDSQAVALAKKYMKAYFPQWYAKYPEVSRGTSYLTSFAQMRWHLSGNCLMSDPEGLSRKNAEQVLKEIFS